MLFRSVASMELHAALEMVAKVKEKELAKKSAAAKIVAVKEMLRIFVGSCRSSLFQQQSSQLLISSRILFL